MTNKRILVTGSKGFTGRYVCLELKRRGYEVFGLTSDYSIDGQSIDLMNKDALNAVVSELQPASVIHLAAISYVDHGCESDFMKVNVEGTANLLDVIQSHANSLPNVVVASSANIYGKVRNSDIPIKEDIQPNPMNAYAESKVKMEEMIGLEFSDLQTTIVRPFNYTGIGQSVNFLVPKIVQAYKKRSEVLKLGNLHVARDFSDVRFVAWAYSELISRCITGETVNICSGISYSISEILEMCQVITRHCIRVESEPSCRRLNEIESLCGDINHMVKLLGTHSHYKFFDTLRWMLSY